ncbi:T9SS type A sorting domain-containing protein [Limibacter armeniacum]|uniref:T9SS type A sorting domain-containing protein n=1 Tax=Limibacter armeniacum TaxID=466084 RepID=UPI002FE53034
MKLIFTFLLAVLLIPTTWAQSPISFKLIRTDSDTEVGTLANGITINQNQFPGSTFSVQAIAESLNPGSVILSYDGAIKSKENVAPYALFGDSNGNYEGSPLTVGNHTVTAVAYSGSNGSGSLLGQATVQFTVSGDDTPPPPSGDELTLQLIHTSTNTVVTELQGNYILNLSEFNSNAFSVIAISSKNPESVKFQFNTTQRTENIAPYALFGDVNGALIGKPIAIGSYNLSATAYSNDNASGNVLEQLQVTLTVIGQDTPPPPTTSSIKLLLTDIVSKNAFELENSSSIDLGSDLFPQKEASLIYLTATAPEGTESMQLTINGSSRLENVAPYSFFGDAGNIFNGKTFPPGNYTLTAKAYSQDNLQGTLLAERTITFSTVLDTPPTPVGLSTRVVYTPNNSTAAIPDYAPSDVYLKLSDYAQNAFNIEVIPSGTIGSIETKLSYSQNSDDDNPEVFSSIQSTAPYYLFGDQNGQPIGETLQPGRYELEVIAYSGANGTGEVIESISSPGLFFYVFENITAPKLYLADAISGERLIEIPQINGYILDLSQFNTENFYFDYDKGSDPIIATNPSIINQFIEFGPLTFTDEDGRILPYPLVNGGYEVFGGYRIDEFFDQKWEFTVINAPDYPESPVQALFMVHSNFTTPEFLKSFELVTGDTISYSQYIDPNSQFEDASILNFVSVPNNEILQVFLPTVDASIYLFEEPPYSLSIFNRYNILMGIATYKIENDKRVLSGFKVLDIFNDLNSDEPRALNVKTLAFNTELQEVIGALPLPYFYEMDYNLYPLQTIVVEPKYEIGSVNFVVNGEQYHTSNNPPYSLTPKDENGIITPLTPPLIDGFYFELIVETWTGPNATGELIERYVRSIATPGFTTAFAVGLDNSQETILQTWPNPSSGKVNIVSPNGKGNIEIVNVLGQNIQNLPSGQHQINLPRGIYLLNYSNGNEHTTQKLIIH